MGYRMKKEELYLKLAKPFLNIGNCLMRKHVMALRKRQAKEGTRQEIVLREEEINGNS